MGTKLKDFGFCEDVTTYLKVKKPNAIVTHTHL